MNLLSIARLVLIGLVLASPALASEPDFGDIATSGSIVLPAATTAVFTNPAALVGNTGWKLSLQGGTPHPMDDRTVRGLLLGGTGGLGGGFGIDTFRPDGPRENRTWLVYGFAIEVPGVDFALGLSGRTGIKNGDGTSLRAGGLLRATSAVTLGATVLDVGNGVDGYGLGVGYDLAPGVALAGDLAFDSDFSNPEIKPGLKLSNGYAGMSVSYGTGNTLQFAKDFSASVFFQVGADSRLGFDYNHGGELPKYYASLTFGL